jgi:hypothetical protein
MVFKKTGFLINNRTEWRYGIKGELPGVFMERVFMFVLRRIRRVSLQRDAVKLVALHAIAGLGLSMPVAAQAAMQAQTQGPVLSCASLPLVARYPGLRIDAVELVPAATLKLPGIAEPMPEHCVVRGKLNERISPVDGKHYAFSFEMRLPAAWNQRFFYQANGGLDGVVVPAYGDILGGGPLTNGLQKGFAVISSDAGHAMEKQVPAIGGALFGVDPQARLDYGYNDVVQLTPMAKELIRVYYGKGPERSYLVGTSNGGRHGMVAAARDSGRYDGIVAGTPGFHLPRSAIAQLWDAQQFASIARTNPATGRPDLESSFSAADLQLVSSRILDRCDALDGLRDGVIADPVACLRTFNIKRDIPVCRKVHDGCLTLAQKAVLERVFSGPRDKSGQPVYPGLFFDSGLTGKGWREWKFVNSIGPRDAIALGFVFSTPPLSPAKVSGLGNTVVDYALSVKLDAAVKSVESRNSLYTQSAMEFMVPPHAENMEKFIAHGGKLIVYQGVSDPVFSALDTVHWYQDFSRVHGIAAMNSARLFLVPGMNHSRGGPATDQFDLVDAIVSWVEQGHAPDAIVAHARGKDALLPNPELPASWSAARTRLLCPFPQVARYQGSGDTEQSSSFRCAK